ncbi:SGNH/GDSL hydrolase family protein [Aquincola sp. MAHUQ-54]|uniref:SGNH/GDSL hydrolase family protein n=1 Tax=Aquincola agrisoli TaxID=3119538 RepID=A0AAW9Q967_9BURK
MALHAPAHAASRQDFYALGSWATPPVAAAPSDANRVNNQTLRQVLRLSLGGESIRVKLSNRYGSAPLVIQAAGIALRNGNERIIAGSGKALTFSGRESFTIPAYGELYSDWLTFAAGNLTELAIDVHIAADTSAGTSPLTLHNSRPSGQIVSYLAGGNQVGATVLPTEATRAAYYFITGVEVSNPRAPGAIVCFGDSITDGSQSSLYANARYPDYLANRVIYGSTIAPMGVVNLGIGGNRVLVGGTGASALARFDRDVLSLSGASHVIVLEGINDISGGNTAANIIRGHGQMIARARARGLKIYGATVTPYGNAPQPREDERLALNAWIRGSGAYDAVIDFDAAIRDPGNPRVMLARYDSGDSLHPNSAGYAAMANAIDLNLFAGPKLRR